MAKLDLDVRSLINHLYFHFSDTWDNMRHVFCCPDDTPPDADLWIEPNPGTNEVRLKKEIREFVIKTDEQMKGFPYHSM